MSGGYSADKKAKVVLINAERLDFDHKLDLSKLSAIADVTRYESDATPEEIIERVQGQDIVISKEIPVPGHIIAKFPPSVRLIQEAGTGFNNVDLAAAKEKGVMVCNCPAYSSDAVAHLVLTLILNFSCSLVPQMRMLQKGNRDNFTKSLQVPHFELQGKVLGLIGGSGGIGSKVAALAEAIGMKVVITSRSPKPNALPLEELLRTSDFISLHCPLNADTKHLINKDTLKLMKPTAYLINTGRGSLIKEPELIEALQNKTIAGAGLDVQETEPPAADNPLYSLENVILTPHIGWKRLETRQRLMDIVADNLTAYLSGKPVNVVPQAVNHCDATLTCSARPCDRFAIHGLRPLRQQRGTRFPLCRQFGTTCHQKEGDPESTPRDHEADGPRVANEVPGGCHCRASDHLGMFCQELVLLDVRGGGVYCWSDCKPFSVLGHPRVGSQLGGQISQRQ